MPGLSTTIGGAETDRQILLLAGIIGAGWIVGTALGWGATLGFVSQQTIGPYMLGGNGLVPVQLITYSFIHRSLSFAALNLAMLWGLVNLARRALSAESFVRIYSLGVVGGGLLFLLFGQLIAGRGNASTSGPAIAIATMLAALAVFRAGARVQFFGAWAAAHPLVVFAILVALSLLEDAAWVVTSPPDTTRVITWLSVDRGVELFGLGVITWVAARELAVVNAARILLGWELLSRCYGVFMAMRMFEQMTGGLADGSAQVTGGDADAFFFVYLMGRGLGSLIAITAGIVIGITYALIERRLAARPAGV